MDALTLLASAATAGDEKETKAVVATNEENKEVTVANESSTVTAGSSPLSSPKEVLAPKPGARVGGVTALTVPMPPTTPLGRGDAMLIKQIELAKEREAQEREEETAKKRIMAEAILVRAAEEQQKQQQLQQQANAYKMLLQEQEQQQQQQQKQEQQEKTALMRHQAAMVQRLMVEQAMGKGGESAGGGGGGGLASLLSGGVSNAASTAATAAARLQQQEMNDYVQQLQLEAQVQKHRQETLAQLAMVQELGALSSGDSIIERILGGDGTTSNGLSPAILQQILAAHKQEQQEQELQLGLSRLIEKKQEEEWKQQKAMLLMQRQQQVQQQKQKQAEEKWKHQQAQILSQKEKQEHDQEEQAKILKRQEAMLKAAGYSGDFTAVLSALSQEQQQQQQQQQSAGKEVPVEATSSSLSPSLGSISGADGSGNQVQALLTQLSSQQQQQPAASISQLLTVPSSRQQELFARARSEQEHAILQALQEQERNKKEQQQQCIDMVNSLIAAQQQQHKIPQAVPSSSGGVALGDFQGSSLSPALPARVGSDNLMDSVLSRLNAANPNTSALLAQLHQSNKRSLNEYGISDSKKMKSLHN